ncbi:MAG: hypothetical protein JXQ66_02790, partial [Campylobacterales bacterium]|nr:hypothetical protein [Campylobacterales bacterium]
PVIMVTASGEDDDLLTEAFNAGVNDFLSKPINYIHFRARVQNQLKLRQACILLEDRAKFLEIELISRLKK